QVAYNREHNITPRTIEREVTDIMQALRARAPEPAAVRERARSTSREDRLAALRDLEEQMLEAAQRLEFELAASLRDEIRKLRKDL
ncbi:MAG: UvrB/UvrC motif-containing protein, partial [Candidatus Bipolaricaulota bacterium]|nr:UvrB/UvrC motif-containing protein [Candidatus Bipolaricaulota bacterium]